MLNNNYIMTEKFHNSSAHQENHNPITENWVSVGRKVQNLPQIWIELYHGPMTNKAEMANSGFRLPKPRVAGSSPVFRSTCKYEKAAVSRAFPLAFDDFKFVLENQMWLHNLPQIYRFSALFTANLPQHFSRSSIVFGGAKVGIFHFTHKII